MKKLLLIGILLTSMIQANELTAETCIGLTNEVIKNSTPEKKSNTITNLKKLCFEGCGKACIEGKKIEKNVDMVGLLNSDDHKKGCDVKFPSGIACNYIAIDSTIDDKALKLEYAVKSCISGFEDGCLNAYHTYNENKDYVNVLKYLNFGCNDLESYSCCDELGVIYFQGKGIAENKVKSYQFMKKALTLGSPYASRNLDVLCKNSPWACK